MVQSQRLSLGRINVSDAIADGSYAKGCPPGKLSIRIPPGNEYLEILERFRVQLTCLISHNGLESR